MTNPPTDDKYYFSLVTTTANKNTELCNRALNAKLTWEGITNGESCISITGAPTSTGGSSNATCVPIPVPLLPAGSGG